MSLPGQVSGQLPRTNHATRRFVVVALCRSRMIVESIVLVTVGDAPRRRRGQRDGEDDTGQAQREAGHDDVCAGLDGGRDDRAPDLGHAVD